jgi:2-polyprenyl-3-methyl-5-hydroxy-6-metoxy-1,4-benzoquinol methylase
MNEPGASVADVACGVGWAAISLAKGYPNITVDGFDLDGPSIEIATRNAKEAGVADRVRFEVKDAADTALQGRYDLALVVEAVHDLSQPVAVLPRHQGHAQARRNADRRRRANRGLVHRAGQ